MSTRTNDPSPAPTSPAPVAGGFTRDVRNVFVRELRPTLHDPWSMLFSLIQPVVFLGLFGPLLLGSSGAPRSEVLAWFVPGILVMIALFATSFTGAGLLLEMQTGSHERTLVAPLARSSLMVGRALKEMVPLMIQVCVITAVTVPFGFRPSPLGMLIGLVLIAVFAVGFGALSYTLALVSRERDWLFWTVQQAVLFPLMILSGMLLPLEDGPEWMQAAAKLNPLSYIVDAERQLFAGDLMGDAVVPGFIAAAILCAIGLLLGIRTMRRA